MYNNAVQNKTYFAAVAEYLVRCRVAGLWPNIIIT